MRELKKAYQLVQYGMSIKKQFGFALLFALIGIGVEIASKGTEIVGSFYIVLSGMFLYQLIISSDNSTLIQSSPYKKKIQCFYPIMAVLPWIYLTLGIVSIVHVTVAKTHPDLYDKQCHTLLLLGSLMLVLMLYFGMAYKFFVASTIFMVMMIFAIEIAVFRESTLSFLIDRGIGFCVFTAFFLTTLGAVGCLLLNLALYKKPLSKWAFRGMFNEGKGL